MKFKLALLMIMFMGLAVAGPVYKQDEEVNYRFRCYDASGAYCTSSTTLIINVEYPNGTNAVDNQTMTFGNTYFNATLPTSVVGEGYEVLIHSTTSNNTVTEFSYDVTYTGDDLTPEVTNLYLGLLAVVFFFLFISIWFIGKLPSSNSRDDATRIITINHLKHLRKFMWGVVYITIFAIFYIASVLSIAYLPNNIVGGILWAVAMIMGYGSLIFFPIMFMKIIEDAWHDSEIKRLQNRGLELDDKRQQW